MASGHVFRRSSFDLHKNVKNLRSAFKSLVKNTFEQSIKVWCPCSVSSFIIIRRLSLSFDLNKKFFAAREKFSAVVCSSLPERKCLKKSFTLNFKSHFKSKMINFSTSCEVGDRRTSSNCQKTKGPTLKTSPSLVSARLYRLFAIALASVAHCKPNSSTTLLSKTKGSTLITLMSLVSATLTSFSLDAPVSKPHCKPSPLTSILLRTKGPSLQTAPIVLFGCVVNPLNPSRTKGSTLKISDLTGLTDYPDHPTALINSTVPSQPFSIFKSSAHSLNYSNLRLVRAGNVETNPGPRIDVRPAPLGQLGPQQAHQPGLPLMLTTYNVRGLNDENKLRHLLSYFHSKDRGKSMDTVICLQETYIDTPGKIPYIWRGNFFLTPGRGNSCGCLTLLSPHLNVVASSHLENRAHVIACQRVGENNVSVIIANIYAPNPNTREKVDFFEAIFQLICEMEETYNCRNTFVAGDFNLIFNVKEAKNRNYAAQEQRIARTVKTFIDEARLRDIWQSNQSFTWRRANSDVFSTIDRVLFSAEQYKQSKLNVNWSLSYSDHAAIEISFTFAHKPNSCKSRITRLDPSLAKYPCTKNQVIEGYDEMMATMPVDWDPHKKLEFSKLCIRTICENVQAERKRREASEEDTINEELEMAINKLSRDGTLDQANLLDFIEELRSRKQNLINIKGERLAERLGTKWYNEGEKSTKYFMRILNRSMPDQFQKIVGENGDVITDGEAIEDEIVNFYKNLYESYTPRIIDPAEDADFFNNLTPISDNESSDVTKEITVEELAATIETCKDSSPGPDGIPYSIIRLLWYSFGELLCQAWRYSLANKQLPPSHRMSYLRLIPKAGKDLTKLTNWRPITLSNCDHKIITKTYARRMCENVAKQIAERQTAYLKGRLINDNIRSMISTINVTNVENVAAGLIVALDAKKAFDSVEHSYIREVLRRFGCCEFIPIFDTLYSDLETGILVNGKISKSYKIRRGVKQGDSLSCILFIMCMEPLLRNIESNADIAPISSRTLNTELPKVYAYADDVNGTVLDSDTSLKSLFAEYERLTKLSGLELNADKTELMRLGENPEPKTYKIEYLNKEFEIKSCDQIKINGILFQRNQDRMVDANIEAARQKIEANLSRWSRRHLSTLGKILIVKTFGISQIIYLLQSLVLKNAHVKVLNAILYKFIWNKHFHAAKAPERIKRSIVTTPIKLGGLGMLDICQLDEGLKVRALGRLFTTKHPFLSLLKTRLDMSNFFDPICTSQLDPIINQAMKSLRTYREGLWRDNTMARNRGFLMEVNKSKIGKLISATGRVSISYFLINRSGKRLIGDLSEVDLNNLATYMEGHKLQMIRAARVLNGGEVNGVKESIVVRGRFKSLQNCSSKIIRDTFSKPELITSYKIGLDLSRSEALNWANRLSKLCSVRHRNILLRVAHGEIYTNEKLARFGLIDSNKCDRCDEVDTLLHKFIDCGYVKEIWKHLSLVTASIRTTNQVGVDPIKSSLSATMDSNLTITTINAEILQRILTLKRDQDYLIHPKRFIEHALKLLLKRERKGQVKDEIADLLQRNF